MSREQQPDIISQIDLYRGIDPNGILDSEALTAAQNRLGELALDPENRTVHMYVKGYGNRQVKYKGSDSEGGLYELTPVPPRQQPRATNKLPTTMPTYDGYYPGVGPQQNLANGSVAGHYDPHQVENNTSQGPRLAENFWRDKETGYHGPFDLEVTDADEAGSDTTTRPPAVAVSPPEESKTAAEQESEPTGEIPQEVIASIDNKQEEHIPDGVAAIGDHVQPKPTQVNHAPIRPGHLNENTVYEKPPEIGRVQGIWMNLN